MRLYIIRHADPEYHGDTLTEHGQLEAQALARRLADDPQFALTRIYCSPMGRAKATAKYTSELLQIPIEVEDWTKELTHWGRISDKSGRPGEGGFALWDIAGEVVRGIVPRVDDESQWELVPDMISVKKDYEELVLHSDRFLAKLGYKREGGRYHISKPEDRQQQVAVFCHGGFGLTWLSHLLYLPLSLFWCSFWLAPSSVTTVLFEERTKNYAVPRCIGLGDISHLYASGLRIPNSSYEKANSFYPFPRPSGIKSNFF
ncbi:hypothetical protein GpartN1_g1164.t1 [Galdieria partita]|uniref:Histidine phosphatase family protein n=1 Tax=Galdieria partita TaxID=83374 RepID=A0A9C7PRL4_9RHOD|nr:hypothetical protein GpartN1_g1164.t1 [Galdieria partita]